MKRNKRIIQSVISIIALILLIGCSSYQKIRIKSEPSQAKVFVDTSVAGSTPCIVKIKKKEPAPTIRIEKDGYASNDVTLKKVFNIGYPIKTTLLSGVYFAVQLLSESLFNGGKVTKHSYTETIVGTSVFLGVELIGGVFTGDYYKFKPQKINISLDKIMNPPDPTIKNKNELLPSVNQEQINSTITKDSSTVIDTVETKPNDNKVSSQQPESQMPEKE